VKNHNIVLLSGGIDSRKLMEWNINDGNTILPVHIQMNQPNAEDELVMANNIVIDFMEKYPNQCTQLEIHYLKPNESSESPLHYQQIPLLIMGALYSMKRNTKSIHIGYIKGDDAISVLNEIQITHHTFKPFCKWHCQIEFPLKNNNKY
jgi:7-cyano-7-deazaguanine synthase in queuosine biosynthesis